MHLSEKCHIRYLHSISELEKSQKRNFQLHDLLTLIGLAQPTPPQAPPLLPLRILITKRWTRFLFRPVFQNSASSPHPSNSHIVRSRFDPNRQHDYLQGEFLVSSRSSLSLSVSRSDHVRPRVATLGLVCLFVNCSVAEPRNLRISSPETSSFPTRTLSSWSMISSTRLTVL